MDRNQRKKFRHAGRGKPILSMQQLPLNTVEAKQMREAFLEQYPKTRDFLVADFSELERRFYGKDDTNG